MRKLQQGRVYWLHYRCDTPGPEVEEDYIRAYWTGEIDTWGKLTFQPIGNSEPYYLFHRELVSVEPV